MVNTALEKYRDQYRKIYVYDDIPEQADEPQVETSSEIGEMRLIGYIQELPPKYRAVFNLYAIEGHSHKEISRMLKISEGTSKSNLSRARVLLKEKVNRFLLKKTHSK